MKLDLCKMFGVEENQHFWLICHYNESYSSTNEAYIENNYLILLDKNGKSYEEDDKNSNLAFIMKNKERYEIFYTKPKQPVQLTDNTKNFLKLINKDYKYICRDEDGIMWVSQLKPEKVKKVSIVCWYADGDFFELEENVFDIDLSFY